MALKIPPSYLLQVLKVLCSGLGSGFEGFGFGAYASLSLCFCRGVFQVQKILRQGSLLSVLELGSHGQVRRTKEG